MGTTEDRLQAAANKRRGSNPAQVGNIYSDSGSIAQAQVQVQAQVHDRPDSGRPALNIRISEPVKIRMHRMHVLVPEKVYRVAEKEARRHKVSVAELIRQILEQALTPS